MKLGAVEQSRGLAFAAAFGVIAFGAGMAQAADQAPLRAPAPAAAGAASDWTVTIGAEPGWGPSYVGSDRNRFGAKPVFSVRRANVPRGFTSPRDGFGFSLFDQGNFRVGPVGQIRMPRYEGDDADLRGLGKVDFVFEAGVFAEMWWAPWLRTRGELRHGIGGHHGLIGDLNADVVLPVTRQLTFSAGPRMRFASSAALSPYFGVTPVQSINSGLPLYSAKGGVHAWGAGAQLRYDWTRQFATYAFVEYDRLVGSAADSPLVRQRGSHNQTYVGLGVTYSFDIAGFW